AVGGRAAHDCGMPLPGPVVVVEVLPAPEHHAVVLDPLDRSADESIDAPHRHSSARLPADFMARSPEFQTVACWAGSLATIWNKTKLWKVFRARRQETGDRRMKVWVAVVLVAAMPQLAAAAEVELNDQQKLGWRLYETSCGICHTRPTLIA